MAAGDVLLMHRPTTWANFKRDKFGTVMTALIHLTTRSRYNHAALDIGDGMMVEATSKGVTVGPIASVDEIRVIGAINDDEQWPWQGCGHPCGNAYRGDDLEQTLAWSTGRVGWRYGYATAFFCGLRNVFPGFSIVQDKAVICSQLVAEALERAGHDFTKDSARVSPGDLAEHFGVPRR
jgi:uncharacterized protein YycO